MKRMTKMILTVLLTSIIFWNQTENIEATTVLENEQKSIKFRQEFGLNYSTDYLREVVKNKNNESSERKYGVLLTEEEEKEIDRRMEIQTVYLSKIKEKIKEIKEDISYGGLYIDQKNLGTIYIGIKKDLSQAEKEKYLKYLTKDYPYKKHVEFFKINNTIKELDEKKEILINFIKERTNNQIVIVATDYPGQKILLTVKKLNSYDKQLVKEFEKLHNVKVVLQQNKNEAEPVSSRTDYHQDIIGGLRILNTDQGYGKCTTGYAARSSSYNYYAVTAAHCGYAGEYFSQGGSTMGYASSSYNQLGGSVDAMGIYLGSHGRGVDNQTFGSTYLLKYLEQWYEEDIGQMVCFNGATSGASCGVLKSKNITLDYDDGAKQVSNQRAVDGVTVDEGDSGGTVYNRNTLNGIVVAKGSMYDGYYTHARNIYEELGLYPILN
ncbi:S1 family peptidase [Gracilibacillus sp. YIM 98692]|uniref:S1 family peptidase n=1 Tax=Gracilibacillus sp. YIM 98692 TaxID=2663532 RepID=UPI0013D8CE42|nr:S1 family peptidase [Gracilibacillus sp. YIM 98692]